MAAAIRDAQSMSTQQRGVLASLSQQAAAELVGRPAYYFRDHAGEIPRNPDQSYDAREVVRWALGQSQPAELPDELLEPVLQLVDWVGARDEDYRAAFRALDDVVRQYGGAGLAAIGRIVVDQMKAAADVDRLEASAPQTLEEIEAKLVREAQAEAESKYRRQAEYHARRDGMLVTACSCGQWRQGRKWHKEPMPHGYAASRYKADCPDCIARARRA